MVFAATSHGWTKLKNQELWRFRRPGNNDGCQCTASEQGFDDHMTKILTHPQF